MHNSQYFIRTRDINQSSHVQIVNPTLSENDPSLLSNDACKLKSVKLNIILSVVEPRGWEGHYTPPLSRKIMPPS